MTHAAELDLEQLIDDLARQFWKAKSGSAEQRRIVAELKWLLPQEMARPYMEDRGIFIGNRGPGRGTEPAQVIPLSPRGQNRLT
jgi:hypothetical protein